MADNKSKNESGNKKGTKNPKRDKYYEPGFFNDYGGCGIIITKRPENDKKEDE